LQNARKKNIIIRLLHNFNNNFVLLQYYNNYSSIIILLLFESILVDILKTIYNILSKQQKQSKKDKILICLSINLDSNNTLNLVTRKNLYFRNIIVR